MNKIAIPLVLLLVTLVVLATFSDLWIETNSATGATRTKTRDFLFFTSPWREESTWVSERANQLGINTDADWQQITHQSSNCLGTIHACGRAPASYQLLNIDADYLAKEDQDQFVRTFVTASEVERDKMILQLVDGSFPDH